MERIRNGEITPLTDWRDYMITDAGLDAVGTAGSQGWLGFLAAVILGTNVSPTPVRRDSAGITFTQAGTTLTASGAFFSVADVGRLFKWGASGSGSGGVEVYITAFTSSMVVTVSVSATVAVPSEGVVWYVNTAALLTPIAGLTWTKDSGGANNFNNTSTLSSVATVTSQTVLISSALAAPATVTEIAFNNNTTNSNVFDRDLINPPVALLAGDQARVTVQLIRNYSPITTTAVPGNVGAGLSTVGDMQIESLNMDGNGGGISEFAANGSVPSSGNNPLDPGSNILGAIISGSITFQAFSFTTETNRASFYKTLTAASYGSGNRYRDFSGTLSISQGNGTINGVGIFSGLGEGSATSGSFVTWKFTTPGTKLSTQTLAITLRKSWSRVLTN